MKVDARPRDMAWRRASLKLFSNHAVRSRGGHEKNRSEDARLLDRSEWRAVVTAVRRRMKRRVDDIDEALDIAVERLLSGKRQWKDDHGFTSFLATTVQSVVWAERAKEKRRAHVETEYAHAEEQRTEASPEALRLRAERHARLRDWLAEHTEDDPEVAALCRAILDGAEKPREQASVLGWSADHVDAVLKRLQRRLLEAAQTRPKRGASSLRCATPRELESDLRARDE